jgi:iron complex outermembrane receptor protein
VDVVGTASGMLTNSLIATTNAGSRLGLTALDTPASVTTLAGTDIRLRGDVSVNSSVTRAVGITSTMSTGGGGNTVAARGFGGSSVAFLYDGIRNQAGLGNRGWPYDPWTVDRIEVLNGPASVLYGIGASGARSTSSPAGRAAGRRTR